LLYKPAGGGDRVARLHLAIGRKISPLLGGEEGESARHASVVGRWSRKLLLALPFLAALAVVSGASAHTSGITIRGLTKPVYTGQTIGLHVVVRPGSDHCSFSISYAGGKVQKLGDRLVGPSGTTWSFRIPAVPAGVARATLICAELGRSTSTFRVKVALQAPKIDTVRTGFTQRMNERAGTSDVCFGLELHNARARADATNLAVLVNLVDADNRVVASDHLRLTRIPAGGTFYTGDQIHMGLFPVARVEVVAVEARSEAIQPATPPLISDILITQDRTGGVATVYGQLLNQSPLSIQGGELGTILVNVDGNIIGGARGIVHGPVSRGARELFSTSGLLSAVPFASATQALVSIVPRYPRQLN
jgi:hypothetical protein